MELKEIFRSDRAILIACIFISGIFWMMNKMSQQVNWEKKVPILYNLPDEFVFSDPPREELIFTVEGTGWQMLSLSRKDLDSMIIDIPARSGNHTWNNEQLRQMIKDEKVEEDMNITKVDPFRLSVSITKASRRCYAVDLRKKITYTAGYQNLNPIQLSPDSICITGPSEYLVSSGSWPVDSLILDNVNSSREGYLQVINEYPMLLKTEPYRIKYKLEVAEFTELKKYAQIRIVNRPDIDSISLFPSRALVSMQVPLDRYEQAKQQDFNLLVNLNQRNQDSNVVEIQVPENIPVWMKNVQVNPNIVEYYYISKDTSANQDEDLSPDQ